MQGFSPAHFRWLRSTQFSTAGPAQHGWEQLENPQTFGGQMLSNIFNACFVLSPARARGGERWCSANVTIMIKVEVSKAALTLLEGVDPFLLPFTTLRGAANGDVRTENHQFPVFMLLPQLSTGSSRCCCQSESPRRACPRRCNLLLGFGAAPHKLQYELVENQRSPG